MSFIYHIGIDILDFGDELIFCKKLAYTCITFISKQQREFIDYVAKNPFFFHWYPFFVFLLGTGCRICSTVSDVYAGETLEHDFCDEAAEDGIYVEVTEDEPYCTRDSKVYVVQDGEVVYEETLSEYGDEFESYFE